MSKEEFHNVLVFLYHIGLWVTGLNKNVFRCCSSFVKVNFVIKRDFDIYKMDILHILGYILNCVVLPSLGWLWMVKSEVTGGNTLGPETGGVTKLVSELKVSF